MPQANDFSIEGGCTCRAVRYRMLTKPMFVHCCHCRIALWSNYGGAGDTVRFVRVGTLDDPNCLPPDIHIYTASKPSWVVLPPGTPAVAEYYKSADYWPSDSLARRKALLG